MEEFNYAKKLQSMYFFFADGKARYPGKAGSIIKKKEDQVEL